MIDTRTVALFVPIEVFFAILTAVEIRFCQIGKAHTEAYHTSFNTGSEIEKFAASIALEQQAVEMQFLWFKLWAILGALLITVWFVLWRIVRRRMSRGGVS